MSWRIGIENLLHHVRLAGDDGVATRAPRTLGAIIRRSIAKSVKRNMFIDGSGSPLLSIVTKCMRTRHLKERIDICYNIFEYFTRRPERFLLTPVEDHFAKLFQCLKSDREPESAGDWIRRGEAEFILLQNWDAALHAYLRALMDDSFRNSQCPPMGLLHPWAMQNPRERWRESLRILEGVKNQERSHQHTACAQLLHELGPLGWAVWKVHASGRSKASRNSNWALLDPEYFAIATLPPWKERWRAAFRAFQVILSQQPGKFNYENIDVSQALWTKLGQQPGTPHLYLQAMRQNILSHVNPWRIAGGFRSFGSIEKAIGVFRSIQCTPDIISSVLLQLLTMFHFQLHSLCFTTIVAADSVLMCVLPELKELDVYDISFYLIMTQWGLRVDGEPMYSFHTRIYAGQTLSVDFGAIHSRVRLQLTESPSAQSRFFVDSTKVLAPRKDLTLNRRDVYCHSTSFKRETADDGRGVIQFTAKPPRFFQPWPSETTLVKYILPYFARVRHPMAWNDVLPDEQRTFELLGVDLQGEPSIHMYTVCFDANTSHSFSYPEQIIAIRKYLASHNLPVLGDPDYGGPHASTALGDKPLISLAEQRFRHPHTGERVIFEKTTAVSTFWKGGYCGPCRRSAKLRIPLK